MSAAATMRFQGRTTDAILAGLTAGTVEVQARDGVVTLWSPTVVWGTDQTALAELSRDCGAIRARGGPWVRLSPDQSRMARMAREVGLAAGAEAAKKSAATTASAQALIGTVITVGGTDWLITHVMGGCPVGEPVDLTDEQRTSRDLLARRFRVGPEGAVAIAKETCLAYDREVAAGAFHRPASRTR